MCVACVCFSTYLTEDDILSIQQTDFHNRLLLFPSFSRLTCGMYFESTSSVFFFLKSFK